MKLPDTYQREETAAVAAGADDAHDGGVDDDGSGEDHDDERGDDEVVVVVLLDHIEVIAEVGIHEDEDTHSEQSSTEQLQREQRGLNLCHIKVTPRSQGSHQGHRKQTKVTRITKDKLRSQGSYLGHRVILRSQRTNQGYKVTQRSQA